MAAKLERTGTPGIFRRHAKDCTGARCGCPYVVVWRHRGRQHTETFRTLAEAREAKRTHESNVARGEFAPAARETLHDYARQWVERYNGTGRRGFREETRREYRALLEKYTLDYFPPRLRLTEITPREVADFIGWLVEQPNGRGGTLSDKSVRNALGPGRACLATARREGLIRSNPADGAALPHRPRIEEDEKLPRPFPGSTMELVVSLVHPDHRLMFELLAATGVRRSELLAFERRHLGLSGDRPEVRVRQRARAQKGQGMVIGPIKSRYARRDLPIGPSSPTDWRGSGYPTTRSSSRARTPDGRTIRGTSSTGCCHRPVRRRALSGPGFTPSDTPSRSAWSRTDEMPSRSSGGLATTRRASRSTPTCTCSTGISARHWSHSGSPAR